MLVAHKARTACGSRFTGGKDFSVKHTAVDREIRAVAVIANETAMRAVAGSQAVDRDAAAAVLDFYRAVLCTDETARVLFRGVDRARCAQILDDAAALGIAERRRLVVVADGLVKSAVADGQRMSLSVEGAGEVVIGAARHSCYGDISAELHGFVVEIPLGVVGEQVAEGIPARFIADSICISRFVDIEVRDSCRARVCYSVECRCCRSSVALCRYGGVDRSGKTRFIGADECCRTSRSVIKPVPCRCVCRHTSNGANLLVVSAA